MFHFCNNCLNSFNVSSLFSGGIIISSTGCYFTILSLFDLVTASGILSSKNSPALWSTFLEEVFGASSAVSNNFFLYFLANDRDPYPLAYFLVLGSVEYYHISV